MEETKLQDKIDDYTCLMKVINTKNMPFYHKICLTLEEAAQYSGIGIHKMRQICDQNDDLVIWNGGKRMIKREKLEKFLEKEFSI